MRRSRTISRCRAGRLYAHPAPIRRRQPGPVEDFATGLMADEGNRGSVWGWLGDVLVASDDNGGAVYRITSGVTRGGCIGGAPAQTSAVRPRPLVGADPQRVDGRRRCGRQVARRVATLAG